jgi:hypothetical protein
LLVEATDMPRQHSRVSSALEIAHHGHTHAK